MIICFVIHCKWLNDEFCINQMIYEHCRIKRLVMTCFLDSLAFSLTVCCCFFYNYFFWYFHTSWLYLFNGCFLNFLFDLFYISYTANIKIFFGRQQPQLTAIKIEDSNFVTAGEIVVLSCFSCVGLVNKDGGVAVPDAVRCWGGRGPAGLRHSLCQVIGLAERSTGLGGLCLAGGPWGQNLVLSSCLETLYINACEQRRWPRLPCMSVEVTAGRRGWSVFIVCSSLSVRMFCFSCLLHYLPLGKCGPALDGLDSISGARRHRLGFGGLKSNDHLCSTYSYPGRVPLPQTSQSSNKSKQRPTSTLACDYSSFSMTFSTLITNRKSSTNTGFDSTNVSDWLHL